MSNEGFFRRWARLKSTGGDAVPAETGHASGPPAVVPVPPPVPTSAAAARFEAEAPLQAPPPTLEDAARLTPDADFSAFVAKGVDKSVQRLALKKLFADPHFNAIDGLDIYMSDYNKAAPLAPAMLASLKHAQGLVTRLLDDRQEAEAAAARAPALAQEAGQAQEPTQETMQQAVQQPVQQPVQLPPSTQQGNA